MKTGEKYYVIACHVLWRELCHFGSFSPNTLTFHFLKQGLHTTPDLLRQKLQEAIDAVPEDECYTAVLVAYGLCCNGIEGIFARNTRLVFMRGHDCITFLLGSKERYREIAEKSPGTYWYSPGWIETGFTPGKENYETMLRSYTEKYGEDNALYLMETEQGWLKNYSTAAYVNLGFCDYLGYREYTRECADWLGLHYEELEGNPQLITNFLEGRWDPENFLIVEPGEQVAATHDEKVITTKNIGV
ncbi:MAG: DUF1638 domain-containing protein [Candidatus Latescibacter sp.]|nr:DUF1638 domain-containing protein [Candidatus Latescibacter sp.]